MIADPFHQGGSYKKEWRSALEIPGPKLFDPGLSLNALSRGSKGAIATALKVSIALPFLIFLL